MSYFKGYSWFQGVEAQRESTVKWFRNGLSPKTKKSRGTRKTFKHDVRSFSHHSQILIIILANDKVSYGAANVDPANGQTIQEAYPLQGSPFGTSIDQVSMNMKFFEKKFLSSFGIDPKNSIVETSH